MYRTNTPDRSMSAAVYNKENARRVSDIPPPPPSHTMSTWDIIRQQVPAFGRVISAEIGDAILGPVPGKNLDYRPEYKYQKGVLQPRVFPNPPSGKKIKEEKARKAREAAEPTVKDGKGNPVKVKLDPNMGPAYDAYGTRDHKPYNPYAEDGIKAPSLDTITEGVVEEKPDGFTGATRNEHTVEQPEAEPTTPEEVLVKQSSGVVVPQVETGKPDSKPDESVVIQQPKSNKVSVAYQWDEIQDPKSFAARQKERRAYYTSLLETGNVGTAFKAMYAIEEDNLGKWNRNAKRDYYVDQGYTAESVQEYINSGKESDLAKAEALKEATFNDGVWAVDSQLNKKFKLRDITKEDKITTWDDGEGNLYERDSKGNWMKVVNDQGMTAVDGKIQNTAPGGEVPETAFERELRDHIYRIAEITPEDIDAVTGSEHILFPNTAILPSTKTAENKFDTILSKGFLQHIEKMKGYGSLSNAEGSRVSGSYSMLVDSETNTFRLGLDKEVVERELKNLMEGAQNMLLIQTFARKNGREPTRTELNEMRNKVSPAQTTAGGGQPTQRADDYVLQRRDSALR